jgi:hypothetical protein
MKRTIEDLTERQLSLLQDGLILNRETLERLFSIEFMAKHKNLDYAIIILNGDDSEGYFFTLKDDSNTLLCCPSHDSINTEYMIQDLFICGVITSV